MPGQLDAFATLLAQAAPAGPAEGSSNPLFTIVTFLPALVLFYFMIVRPGQTEAKRRRQMIDALKKNDRVLTESGIYGTVVAIDNEASKVVLRVDDERNIRMTFSRASVSRVLDASEKEKAGETALSK